VPIEEEEEVPLHLFVEKNFGAWFLKEVLI
jgi:hypothetical protein